MANAKGRKLNTALLCALSCLLVTTIPLTSTDAGAASRATIELDGRVERILAETARSNESDYIVGSWGHVKIQSTLIQGLNSGTEVHLKATKTNTALQDSDILTITPVTPRTMLKRAAAQSTQVHHVLVVVAQPNGGSKSTITANSLAHLINTSVNNYWHTVTNGQITIQATPSKAVIKTQSTPCNKGDLSGTTDFWQEIQDKTHYSPGDGQHLLAYFARMNECDNVAGLGTVGGSILSGGLTWSNGWPTAGVIGHELGHNLSLGHSQELDCTLGGHRASDSATCTAHNYADAYDIMGISWEHQGYLNADHLADLGLLVQDAQANPTDNGQVQLAPIATGKGLRVLHLAAGTNQYSIEYRYPTGLDSWLDKAQTWGNSGVIVHRRDDPAEIGNIFSDSQTFLLDGDVQTNDSDFSNAHTTLPQSCWVSLAGGQLGIKVISTTSQGAVIQYRNGPESSDTRWAECAKANIDNLRVRIDAAQRLNVGNTTTLGVKWVWITNRGRAGVRQVRTAHQGAALDSTITYTAREINVIGDVNVTQAQAQIRYTREISKANTYNGPWTKRTRVHSINGSVRETTQRGASVRLRTSSRNAGILLERGPTMGLVWVLVDGKKKTQVNMHGRTRRTVLGAVLTLDGKPHQITIINTGTGQRHKLGYDGIVELDQY